MFGCCDSCIDCMVKLGYLERIATPFHSIIPLAHRTSNSLSFLSQLSHSPYSPLHHQDLNSQTTLSVSNEQASIPNESARSLTPFISLVTA